TRLRELAFVPRVCIPNSTSTRSAPRLKTLRRYVVVASPICLTTSPFTAMESSYHFFDVLLPCRKDRGHEKPRVSRDGRSGFVLLHPSHGFSLQQGGVLEDLPHQQTGMASASMLQNIGPIRRTFVVFEGQGQRKQPQLLHCHVSSHVYEWYY
ncbi:unnamed protein product, partial [Ectocarpus sp. 12 AP-2014]